MNRRPHVCQRLPLTLLLWSALAGCQPSLRPVAPVRLPERLDRLTRTFAEPAAGGVYEYRYSTCDRQLQITIRIERTSSTAAPPDPAALCFRQQCQELYFALKKAGRNPELTDLGGCVCVRNGRQVEFYRAEFGWEGEQKMNTQLLISRHGRILTKIRGDYPQACKAVHLPMLRDFMHRLGEAMIDSQTEPQAPDTGK